MNGLPRTTRSWSWHHSPWVLLLCAVSSCNTLPSKYVEQAEPGVTLTALTTSPHHFRDKVVILGGVLVKEQQDGDRVWLHMKNRPLDDHYQPHRPVSSDGAEAGHFWVTVANHEQLPVWYRKWERMTMVGRVIGTEEREPVLMLMFVRGWSYSGSDDAWEEAVDPAYLPTIPQGIHGEFQTQ